MKRSCWKVDPKNAETVRVLLEERGILAPGCKIESEKGFVFIPVTDPGFAIPKKYSAILATRKFEAREEPGRGSLRERLEREGLEKTELENIISSFDCIGDIAIIEIPESLERHGRKIANAIMEQNHHVAVVARKDGPMMGKFRVRKITVIAGPNRTITTYRESGCSFELDAAKVYFSVRLSYERLRIASLVKPKEKILALFAGVGPFPIVIAKKHPDAEIAAIELNPVAVKFLKRNVTLNRSKNVAAIGGDVKKIVPKKFAGWADRIIMPLPHSAGDFLDASLKGANPRGCTVHFYGFVPTRDENTGEKISDIYALMVRKLREKCANTGLKCKITGKRVVRPYAPYVVQVAVDFFVSRKSSKRKE